MSGELVAVHPDAWLDYRDDPETMSLFAEAKRRHADFLRCLRRSLEAARCAGEALNAAKKRLGQHGEWGKVLKKEFGSTSSANVYMRVAREWDTIWEWLRPRGVVPHKVTLTKFLRGSDKTLVEA